MFARFRLRRVVVSCLLCLGFWQFGHGAYIPAKAWVAQELMQRAWRRAENGDERPAPWPWADTWPVAKLSAKGGDIELIVLAGGSGRTLAFGPGHLSAAISYRAYPRDSATSALPMRRKAVFPEHSKRFIPAASMPTMPIRRKFRTTRSRTCDWHTNSATIAGFSGHM
jgi:hypothetical protein